MAVFWVSSVSMFPSLSCHSSRRDAGEVGTGLDNLIRPHGVADGWDPKTRADETGPRHHDLVLPPASAVPAIAP